MTEEDCDLRAEEPTLRASIFAKYVDEPQKLSVETSIRCRLHLNKTLKSGYPYEDEISIFGGGDQLP
jgi:hypothetical protein